MAMDRRKWNNILILGIIGYISMMLLPDYLRGKVAESDAEKAQETAPSQQNADQDSGLVTLLPGSDSISALQFPSFRLENNQSWVSDTGLEIPASELAGRWLGLSGTGVSDEMYTKLKPNLRSPSTLEVIRRPDQEPYRLVYYKLPQFWLIQNWQNDWFAVSVDQHYLFPLTTP